MKRRRRDYEMTMDSSRRRGGRILSIGMVRTVCIDDGWARGSWWSAALRNDSERALRFSSPRR